MWSSDAIGADYGMLLARTDFGVPKHAGISWFAFPLDQPGVEIRPLREMTGEALFNEVFIDGAIVRRREPHRRRGQRLGRHADHAALRAHGHRRRRRARRVSRARARRAPCSAEPRATPRATRSRAASRRSGCPSSSSWRRTTGRRSDPLLRQKLAELATLVEVGRWNALRGKAEAARGGGQAVASIGKLLQTKIMKLSSEIGVDTLGAHGLLAGPDAPDDGGFAAAFLFAPASSIYGGTDQIQRNIAGERSLGLPREPLPHKGEPFEEVLRITSTARRPHACNEGMT